MQIARHHSRQPQAASVIDRGSSLARGLIFHAPLHPQWGMLDLVAGRPGTRTGLAARAGGMLGQLPSFGTSSYIDFAAPPSFDGGQAFTISWVQEPRSGTGNSTVLDVRPPIGSTNSFLIYESATDTAYQLCVGPRDGGGAGRQANFSVGLTSNGTIDRYVLVAPSGMATSTAAYVLYRNGVRITAATGSPFGVSTPTGLRIGALLGSGTDPFEGALGGVSIWQRMLTDAECIVMSTRPSAIYAPHRLLPFGSIAAAGSTTTINAGVGAAVAAGHPASVVLTTRIAAGVGAGVAAGHPALLALHTSIAAGVASAVAAGHPAQLALHTTVAAGVGAAVAAGHSATIDVQTGTTINAGVGAAVAAGHPATINVYETTTINAGVGVATAAGHQATVAAHTVVGAGVGAATAAGHPAALALHTVVQAGVGAAVAAGHPATITVTDPPVTSGAAVWSYVLSNGKTAEQTVLEIHSMLSNLTPPAIADAVWSKVLP